MESTLASLFATLLPHSGDPLMLKLILFRFCPITVAVLIGLAPSSAAAAEGSAVFASVTTTNQEFEMKAQIGVDFGVDVRATRVWVNEVKWIRLQSSIMPEADARALVSSARDKGYDAWYDSSGNQWAIHGRSLAAVWHEQQPTPQAKLPTRQATSQRLQPQKAHPLRVTSFKAVKPATGV